jgi:hypothetical protein
MKVLFSFICTSFLFVNVSYSQGLGSKTHPIVFQLKKTSVGKYELVMELPPNYGFQKDAPHRILLSGKGGVEIKKAELTLIGPTHPKKEEYFEYVKPMPVQLTGKGEVELNAKIFYCDFKKNICIPGKVSEVLTVN